MNKKLVASILAIAMVVVSITYSPFIYDVKSEVTHHTPSESGWVLKWSDEFKGNSLNTDNWNIVERTSSENKNNELQYYTQENVSVENGNLKIKAERRNDGNYYSGRIDSSRKQGFKYGMLEARIKVEKGNQNGVWPAFWMEGNSHYNNVPWPQCGELDIMEHANKRNYYGGCIHWAKLVDGKYKERYYGSSSDDGDYYHYSQDEDQNGNILDTSKGICEYHTYKVVWDEGRIRWFVDGNETHFLSANIESSSSSHDYFNVDDYYFVLNLAIGSNNTDYTGIGPDASTFETATMCVDYVRAYEYQNTDESIKTNSRITSNSWTDVGDYKVQSYVNASNDDETGIITKVGVDNKDSSHIKVKNIGYKGSIIDTQVVKLYPEFTERVENGEMISISWPIVAKNRSGINVSIKTGFSTRGYTLDEGDNQLEGKLFYDSTYKQAAAVVYMGNTGFGDSIEFNEPIVYANSENITLTPYNSYNATSGVQNVNYGNYSFNLYYTKARMGISENDPNHLRLMFENGNVYSATNFNATLNLNTSFENNKSYTFKMNILSTEEGDIFLSGAQNNTYHLNKGINEIERSFAGPSMSSVRFGFSKLPTYTMLDFYDLTVIDNSNGEVVYPAPEQPTEPETELPTTTQESATIEPSTTQEQTTQVDPADVQYEVSNYSDDDEMIPYPEKEGMIFAGWYTDKTYSTPYLEDEGMAYAKFVDRNVLTVMYQRKGTEAVRFLSTIDSLDYKEVGFIIGGKYGSYKISTVKNVNKVYSSILANDERTFPSVFCDSSKYFFTYTIRGMDGNVTPNEWDITPYYITLDGTEVTGTNRFFRFK